MTFTQIVIKAQADIGGISSDVLQKICVSKNTGQANIVRCFIWQMPYWWNKKSCCHEI